MSVHGLAHLAKGTGMTLDRRADEIAGFDPTRGAGRGGAEDVDEEDLNDLDENTGGRGLGDHRGAPAPDASPGGLIVGQHVMAYARDKWRAGQVIEDYL